MKGSRTLMHGSKSSVYKGLRRNENEKRKKKRRRIGQQDSYFYEKTPAKLMFIRV